MSLDKVNSWEKFSEKYVWNIENKISSLEAKFQEKYNVKTEKLKELYTFHAQKQTEDLNKELWLLAQEAKLSWEEIVTIHKNFQEILAIREAAKMDRSLLSKEILERNIDQLLTTDNSLVAKILSPKILQRINNPESVIDELYWVFATTFDSIGWSVKFAADIIAGIFYLPRDIIAFARGKADFETNIEV